MPPPPVSLTAEPSLLFRQQLARIQTCSIHGPAVDLACGRGRHALALAREGVPCIGIDRNREALNALAARATGSALELIQADLEVQSSLPLRPGRAGAILVFRYLHRPLAAAISDALAPGGCLLYETFTRAQAALDHGPGSEAFLLDPGELGHLFPELLILEYEEGLFQDGPRSSHLARLVALKPEA